MCTSFWMVQFLWPWAIDPSLPRWRCR